MSNNVADPYAFITNNPALRLVLLSGKKAYGPWLPYISSGVLQGYVHQRGGLFYPIHIIAQAEYLDEED